MGFVEVFGLVWTLLKDAKKYRSSKSRKQTPKERLELQERWKPAFKDLLAQNFRQKLRSDVVIRDIARMDGYPDTEDQGRGISPWFRVSLIGTYHQGILVGLRWTSLVKTPEGGFRLRDTINADPEAQNAFNALLVGKIPYSGIEGLDIEGDEIYGFPHVYCKFAKSGPYEALEFCSKNQLFQDSLPYYTRLADLDEVMATSVKYGMPLPSV